MLALGCLHGLTLVDHTFLLSLLNLAGLNDRGCTLPTHLFFEMPGARLCQCTSMVLHLNLF